MSIVIDKTRLIIALKMRPKVNSATKRFLFDHVWGLPYHRRTEDAFTQQVIVPPISHHDRMTEFVFPADLTARDEPRDEGVLPEREG